MTRRKQKVFLFLLALFVLVGHFGPVVFRSQDLF